MRIFTHPLFFLMLFLPGFALSAIDVKINFDTNNANQLKLTVDKAQKDCDITISNRETGFHKTYKILKDKHNAFTLPKKMTPTQNKGVIDVVINQYYNFLNYDGTFKVNKYTNSVRRVTTPAQPPNNPDSRRNRKPDIQPAMSEEKASNYADQQARTVVNRIVKSYGERERYDLYLASGFHQGYTDRNYRDLNVALNDPHILKGYNDGLINTDYYIKNSVTQYFTKKLPRSFNAPVRFGTDEFSIQYMDYNPNTLLRIFISGGDYKVRHENLSASFAYREWKNNSLGGQYDYNLYNKMSGYEKIRFERNFKKTFKQIIDKKFNDALKIRNQTAFDEGVKLGKVIRGYELGLEHASYRPTDINFTISSPLLSFVITVF